MSIDRWMRKLWYIYTMEYSSAIKRKTFETVLIRQMNLKPIIQSEVSQKEKNKYHILTYIDGTQKNGTDEQVIFRVAVETQKENRLMDTYVGRKKRVGRMERVPWKHTLTYVKQIASGNLLYDSGNSNWGSVTTQRGGMWQEVEGRLLRKGTSIWMYGRSQLNIVIILQLKINNEKIGKKPKPKRTCPWSSSSYQPQGFK